MALFLFTRKILAGEPIDVFNHGKHTRDFTYIDDIVEGVVRTLDRTPEPDPSYDPLHPTPESSSAPYRVYNIAVHAGGDGYPQVRRLVPRVLQGLIRYLRQR
jgi:UDP-glucuronate 4-epimerase